MGPKLVALLVQNLYRISIGVYQDLLFTCLNQVCVQLLAEKMAPDGAFFF